MPSSWQAPAQTLSALFTLARAAGTGGALQGAARGLASRPTWRPKRRPGQKLCGAAGEVRTWSSHCSPQGTVSRGSEAPQLSCKRKLHAPEAQREELQLQRFQKPPYSTAPPSRRVGGGGENFRTLESSSGIPGCLPMPDGIALSTQSHTWLHLREHHDSPPEPSLYRCCLHIFLYHTPQPPQPTHTQSSQTCQTHDATPMGTHEFSAPVHPPPSLTPPGDPERGSNISVLSFSLPFPVSVLPPLSSACPFPHWLPRHLLPLSPRTS